MRLHLLKFIPDPQDPSKRATRKPCPLWFDDQSRRPHARPSDCLDCAHLAAWDVRPHALLRPGVPHGLSLHGVVCSASMSAAQLPLDPETAPR